MTDVFDRAQEREAEMRDDALADQARRAHLHDNRPSATVCDCGNVIPEGRRRAIPGVQFCVECQADIERRHRFDWGMAE